MNDYIKKGNQMSLERVQVLFILNIITSIWWKEIDVGTRYLVKFSKSKIKMVVFGK